MPAYQFSEVGSLVEPKSTFNLTLWLPWFLALSFTTETDCCFSERTKMRSGSGCLGGSVGWATNFGSGHDLTVCGFEPHVGLCADSSVPGAYFRFCILFKLPGRRVVPELKFSG